MAKIAFDVKGTLSGPHQDKVRRLFHFLQSQGHEMIVWSNSYAYALDIVKELGLKAECMSKNMASDAELFENWIDIAIEDDLTQTWLGAKRIVFINDIPEDITMFKV